MKHCPTCHYEYEDWATTCGDCGTELVAGPLPGPAPPPALDPALFRDWVLLTNVPNVMLANVLKDQLEQDGIPVLMKRARATDIAEWSHNDFAWQDLYVPQRFVLRARRLLTSPPSRPYHETATDDADWEDADEDGDEELVEEDTASGDLLGAPSSVAPSGWYLIDSARPLSADEAALGARSVPQPLSLPSLSRYRQGIMHRKDHLPPPPRASQVLPFRPADAPAPLPVRFAPSRSANRDRDDIDTGQSWTSSRIYRILIGLLLLAWTLPFMLQMIQYFRDTLARFFP